MAAERDLGHSYHVESHVALLQHLSGIVVSSSALDAIVVPTIRTESLQPAVRLAGDTWRTDLDVWRHRLTGFSVPGDVNDAVKFRELPSWTDA